ncbi:MAG: tetratricopeptide repeat protein [Verrucomicrobia bacterium]|nr:MAG: tetratricopeptide repeat protein [Verrucomicrobiota bacterium]
MNTIRILPFLLALLPVCAQAEPVSPAAKPAKPAAPTAANKPLLANQQAFLNLPEERRKEFAKQLGESQRLFQQKRVFETFDALDKTDAVFPDSPESLNLRGACYVELRSFDKAAAAFNKALLLSPENPSINFNIAEVLFVTKKWQEAHDLFGKILQSLSKGDLSLYRLAEFKILLCKKKLGLKDEALALAKKYGMDDDSPYYYFAHAAIAYDDKNLIKAEEWLAMASRIFSNPDALSAWQDTLVEYGYIKSFYGGELKDE